MGTIIHFLQTISGRSLRVLLGIVLLALGIMVIQGIWGIVIAIIGLVPLVAGLLGICLFAPLFGYTLTGDRHTGPISL